MKKIDPITKFLMELEPAVRSEAMRSYRAGHFECSTKGDTCLISHRSNFELDNFNLVTVLRWGNWSMAKKLMRPKIDRDVRTFYGDVQTLWKSAEFVFHSIVVPMRLAVDKAPFEARLKEAQDKFENARFDLRMSAMGVNEDTVREYWQNVLEQYQAVVPTPLTDEDSAMLLRAWGPNTLEGDFPPKEELDIESLLPMNLYLLQPDYVVGLTYPNSIPSL